MRRPLAWVLNMHIKPLSDNQGDFQKEEPSDRPCPKCKQVGTVTYRIWESHCGGYEDVKYSCKCGHAWWVDGLDS